jgi:transposase
MVFVGIDLHKQYSYVVVLNARGDVLDERRLVNTKVAAYIAGLAEPVHVTLEATLNWQAMVEQLEEKVAEVVLAHPKHVKAIASARIKTDKIDARVLADLLRTNLLPAAYIPTRATRDLRDLVRHRAHLTWQRTQLKNRVHAILARYDVQRPPGGLFTRQGLAFLRSVPLRPFHRRIVDDSLLLIEQFKASAKALDKRLVDEVAQRPLAQLLTTIPGIGPYSALVVLAEIDDIARFPTAKHLCSYAGLVPSTHSSGGRTRHGPITKEGSPWLRTVMVEAAQVAVRLSPTLAHYRDRIAAKHGRNAAKVAVARKLLTSIFWMLQRREPYRDPLLATA